MCVCRNVACIVWRGNMRKEKPFWIIKWIFILLFRCVFFSVSNETRRSFVSRSIAFVSQRNVCDQNVECDDIVSHCTQYTHTSFYSSRRWSQHCMDFMMINRRIPTRWCLPPNTNEQHSPNVYYFEDWTMNSLQHTAYTLLSSIGTGYRIDIGYEPFRAQFKLKF